MEGTNKKGAQQQPQANSAFPVRSQNITQLIASTGQTPTTISLQGLESITQQHIIGVSVRYNDSGNNRYSRNGIRLMPLAVAQKAFLTISRDADLKMDSLSLEQLSFERFDGTQNLYFPLDMKLINPKVNISIPFWAAAPAFDFEIEITFFYVSQ